MIPSQTLGRFIHAQEKKHPGSTGELSDLLSSIVLGVKIIGQLIATAGFKGLYGYTDHVNVHGETTQVLDQQADDTLVHLLGSSGHFGLLVSEERSTVVLAEASSVTAKYVVAFDPLDGSSNLGSNIPVGTIFSILRRPDMTRSPGANDFLQTGRHLVAAGYAVYGSKLSFVYSCGDGVHGFTLDPTIGEFVLTEEKIRIPDIGGTYSINEGNSGHWSPEIKSFIQSLKDDNPERSTPYSARYVGSLVADFDRILRNGGIFLYPRDKRHPQGKLRLLYECIPLAFLVEQAGGKATDGSGPILDILPGDIHQHSAFVVGSPRNVEWFTLAMQAV
jgi:fructose-1,6-bisphosphatase I